jgi:hypothetical protein
MGATRLIDPLPPDANARSVLTPRIPSSPAEVASSELGRGRAVGDCGAAAGGCGPAAERLSFFLCFRLLSPFRKSSHFPSLF